MLCIRLHIVRSLKICFAGAFLMFGVIMVKRFFNYFSKFEIILWLSSVTFIVSSFLLFSGENYLTLLASLIGTTALIFNAKGNPMGMVLIIVFALIYGYISFRCAYYGEMITYVGMSAPMALFSLISWLKNPYKGNRAEVTINKIKLYDIFIMLFLTAAVTIVFYFILKAFNTANLIPSTVSVTTSFMAVYLTFRRSPYFALAYAINDIVLIVLWFMVSMKDISYLSVIICFIVFLVNDLYTFYSWLKRQKIQSA